MKRVSSRFEAASVVVMMRLSGRGGEPWDRLGLCLKGSGEAREEREADDGGGGRDGKTIEEQEEEDARWRCQCNICFGGRCTERTKRGGLS